MTGTPKRIGPALAAGLAVLLLIGALVTELLRARIAFSAILGLPAGIVAGLAAFALAFSWLGSAPASARRAVAVGLSAFGAIVLAVLVAGVAWLGGRPSLALPIAAALGLVGAAVAGLLERRGNRGPPG